MPIYGMGSLCLLLEKLANYAVQCTLYSYYITYLPLSVSLADVSRTPRAAAACAARRAEAQAGRARPRAVGLGAGARGSALGRPAAARGVQRCMGHARGAIAHRRDDVDEPTNTQKMNKKK